MFALIILTWLVFAVVTAGIANSKGSSGLGWFLLALIFGPIALLAVAVKSSEIKVHHLETRACPHCAEEIKAEAKVCRFCGRDVPPIGSERENAAKTKKSTLRDIDQALIEASAEGNIEKCRELLSLGANPNVSENRGFTAKKFAQARGHKEVFELLSRGGENK